MWLLSVVLTAFAVNPALVLARNYDIVLTGVEGYDANPEYVGADSFLRIRRSEKTSLPSMYHHINFIKPLPSDTMVEVQIYEVRDNKLVPSWLKYSNVFCDYVEKENRPIFDALAKLYKFEKCPIVGSFKADDWRPDDKLLPPVLPGPERWMFGVKLTSGTTNILKYGVTFRVDRSKGMRG